VKGIRSKTPAALIPLIFIHYPYPKVATSRLILPLV